jgi:rhodanese-related sulfurtransferase
VITRKRRRSSTPSWKLPGRWGTAGGRNWSDAGHIPGALSLPVRDMKSRMRELPRGSEIVAYCRGPYCLYADDAVQLLTDEGRRAARLEEGFPEWKAEGLPIEQSTT